MKYFVIKNHKYDRNNRVVQKLPDQFLGGYIEDYNPHDFEEKLESITRTAIACNCLYIGYAFPESFIHADVLLKLEGVGQVFSAGIVYHVGDNYWVTQGESKSLGLKPHFKDNVFFKKYFFKLG
jgi:hypothetical protein